MKIDDIFKKWDKDSKIDPSKIDIEALKMSELHNDYMKILINERLLLKKYETQYKTLKLDKQEFYLMGPTKETKDKGWELPPSGRVLKSDLGPYLDADKDLINLVLKIGVQKEKISLLESIINTINNRGFAIKNYIDWNKFQAGA